jgi:hypothetical protein
MNRTRLLATTAVLSFLVLPLQAIQVWDQKQINAAADLTILSPVSTTLNDAYLVKWRGGDATSAVGNISFQYVTLAGNSNSAPYPNRGVIQDNSTNNQGDLWSDNAIRVDFQKGNLPNDAIVIYTDNQDTGTDDPLYQVQLRGGVVGCSAGFSASPLQCNDTKDPYRVSVLPLIWKAVRFSDLQAAQSVSLDPFALVPIPNDSPLWMPSQIVNKSQPDCPAEGPYAASTRPPPYELGFCDYSIHFVLDINNNKHLPDDPNQYDNSWYETYSAGSEKSAGAFIYASVVGPYGINSSEGGTGGLGTTYPAYLLLGAEMGRALLTHYGTTLYLDVRSY